jgi:uncharacterized protein YndB with AHSA1/START domain
MPDLTVRKMIAAPREEVFDAWLDPEGIRSWMCPGDNYRAEVKADPRVGGSFSIRFQGTQGDCDHTGTYKIIDRPSKIAFTWISVNTENRETLVTVEFVEHGEITEVVLTHTGLSEMQAPRHAGGWAQIVACLSGYLAGRRANKVTR